jgi:fatty-acyl-CoA synthase
MRRSCCPIPVFHIFGELCGVLNINGPKHFTAFPAILPDTLESMRTIQEEKCSALMGPPIIFLDLLHHPKRKEYDMSSLLYGLIGAAPVNPKLMEDLQREIPVKMMAQVFGQTENTGLLTEGAYADAQRRFLSVGKPMPHTEMKIADTDGRILPIGEEGEVCARGFHIMKGFISDFYISYWMYYSILFQGIMAMKRKQVKR